MRRRYAVPFVPTRAGHHRPSVKSASRITVMGAPSWPARRSPSKRICEPSDAFSWYMERDPLLRSTVVAVGFLDQRSGPRSATGVGRAGEPHRRRACTTSCEVPPLRLATPRWTRTDEVDLDWHLRWVDGTCRRVMPTRSSTSPE